MSPSRTSTGIVAKSYNSRGLITMNADTRPLVRQSNGTLWAALKENTVPDYLHLYRSTDSGFSWERVWQGNFSNSVFRKVGLGTQNTNGPHLSLQVFEHLDLLVLWQSYYDVTEELFNVEPFAWKLSAPGTRLTADPFIATVSLGADSLALDVVYNDNAQYLVYTSGGNLVVNRYKPLYQEAFEMLTYETGTFFDIFQACAHHNGYVDIAILEETESSYALRHIRCEGIEGTFGEKHTIYDPGTTVDSTDIGLARDGYGNLCCVWSQKTLVEDNIDVYWSISKNHGVTWSSPNKIAKEVGHSPYTDPATARLAARSRVLGGRQGFMVSYVHRNPDVVPKTFVRTLATTDGAAYTLGAQREIATHAALPYEPVTGLSWFRPPAASLLDLSDPGQVRVAYQIGEGNSRLQVDTVPVRVGQELLYESAYPSTLASESGSYVIEGANDIQLQINFNVLGAPNSNVDYHALGLTGRVTNRYIAAFKRAGIELRYQRFDPIPDAEMDDRTAYWAPVEFTSVTVLEPRTYDNPLASRGNDSYESHIERDVRRLYVPATMHFSREWVLNRGSHLKRTVWLASFDGNEYEISQVVPHFVSGMIAYYGCNAYVCGPSHDPFSARRLPSET